MKTLENIRVAKIRTSALLERLQKEKITKEDFEKDENKNTLSEILIEMLEGAPVQNLLEYKSTKTLIGKVKKANGLDVIELEDADYDKIKEQLEKSLGNNPNASIQNFGDILEAFERAETQKGE